MRYIVFTAFGVLFAAVLYWQYLFFFRIPRFLKKHGLKIEGWDNGMQAPRNFQRFLLHCEELEEFEFAGKIKFQFGLCAFLIAFALVVIYALRSVVQ